MNDQVWLEPASMRDCGFWFVIRNEPTVRAASRYPNILAVDRHRRWFRQALRDPKRRLFILLVDAGPRHPDGARIGFVRLDRQEQGTEVSLAMWPWARSRGWGQLAISKAVAIAAAEGWPRCRAVVRSQNVTSVLAFVRAGFVIERPQWLGLVEERRESHYAGQGASLDRRHGIGGTAGGAVG